MPYQLSALRFVALLLAIGLLNSSFALGSEPTFAQIVEAAKRIEAVGGRVNVAWEPPEPGVMVSFVNRRHYVLSKDIKEGDVIDSIRFRDGPNGWERLLFGDDSKPEDWPAKRSVRDGDLKVLARFPKLKFLTLRNCQIGDEGLAEVQGLHSLVSLDIKGTHVTDAGA